MSSAAPMSPNQRILSYLRGSGRADTPRQRRRRRHKLGRLAHLERMHGVGNVPVKGQQTGSA